MHTPNGRFQINVRLCLSISDFHPETWSPTWTIESILLGLISFMNAEESAVGVIGSSQRERKEFAVDSLEHNKRHVKDFDKIFGQDLERI